MYDYSPGDQLGFSLKPPSWLRNAAADLLKGKPTSVPVPGGSTVTVTPPTATQKDTPLQQVNAGVESIPGGWLTIAAVGLFAVLVLPKMLRGSRR